MLVGLEVGHPKLPWSTEFTLPSARNASIAPQQWRLESAVLEAAAEAVVVAQAALANMKRIGKH